MGTRHILLLLGLIIAMGSCKEVEKQDTTTEIQEAPTEKHHKEHKKHHSANEYMHQRPVEELIKSFESPERDAYQQPEKVLAFLGDIADKRIMDIGAGSGYFSVKLAEKGAQVIAADVSEEFQAALKKRIEDNNLTNIELRKIPYDSPNLATAEVDMVLIVNTYHHIENRSEYFQKVREGTKETGALVLIDFFKADVPVGPPTDHKIAIDQVVAELKEAGYSKFEVTVDLLPYQYIIRAK